MVNTHPLFVTPNPRLPLQVCRKCAKQKENSSGTITQWLSTCSCDLVAPSKIEEERRLYTCPRCGQRIGSTRSGTLTQWVFGPGTCNCSPRTFPTSTSAPTSTSTSTSAPTSTSASTRAPTAAPAPALTPNPTSASAPKQEETRLLARLKQVVEASDNAPQAELVISVNPSLFPLDRFKPLARLGSGVAGEVYLCRDKLLRKKVAVKTLRIVSDEQLVAFQREAKATCVLNHPNIVSILDFGVSEASAPYMVLSYVPGDSLDQYLDEYGPMDWEQTVSLAMQLSSALGYAHKNGIYHRDLKPSNVLIEENDGDLNVYLIDFGVAKIKAQTTDAQSNTGLVGTPAYMSPDLAIGKPYDASSEIYSLGCLMFECLTGRPPFHADSSMEFFLKHAMEEVPSLSELGVNLPESVEKIVYNCLEKVPSDRYQSMDELEEDLEIAFLDPNLVAGTSFETAQNTRTFTTSLYLMTSLLMALIAFACLGLCCLFEHSFKNHSTHKTDLYDWIIGTRGQTNVAAALTKHFADKYPTALDRESSVINRYYKLNDHDLSYGGAGDDRYSLDADRKRVVSRHGLGVTFTYADARDRAIRMYKQSFVVDFSYCLLNAGTFKSLCEYRNLSSLSFTGCKGLKESDFESLIARNPNITKLRLAQNALPPESLGTINRLVELRFLDLQRSKLAPQALRQVINKQPLFEVNLSKCHVDGTILKAIASKRGLNAVVLSYLTDRDLELLSNARVGELHLDECPNITRSGFLNLAHNRHLKRLFLTQCPSISREDIKKFEELNVKCEVEAHETMFEPWTTW